MLPQVCFRISWIFHVLSELDADCDDAIEEFIDTTKEEDIPVDGFQLSSASVPGHQAVV